MASFRRSAIGFALAIAAVVLSGLFLGLLVYDLQEALLFHPIPWRPNTPQRLGLDFEEIELTSSDGVRLSAWWIPTASPSATILYCGGNVGNMGVRVPAMRGLSELGCNLLLFDYRGYGRSRGRPTEQGVYRDAAAAWSWLVHERGVAPHDVIVWGRSMGGAVAVWLATEPGIGPPAALVVEATFSSLPALGTELYPWLPVRSLSRMRFDSLARIRTLDAPFLVAHSAGDEVVGIHHAESLLAAAPSPDKHFVALLGGHHSSHLTEARYHDQVVDFIARATAP